jgi:ABC-type uncharacterized transport system substrate-binding protein
MSETFPVGALVFRSDNWKSKIQNPKWGWIVAIGVTFAMCGAVAEAQQPAKVPKIGWLVARSPSGPGGASELFLREFRKLGYVEGKNIAIEYRFADDKLDRLPTLVDDLVRLKVDVLVTPATTEALALKNATRTIPVVF